MPDIRLVKHDPVCNVGQVVPVTARQVIYDFNGLPFAQQQTYKRGTNESGSPGYNAAIHIIKLRLAFVFAAQCFPSEAFSSSD